MVYFAPLFLLTIAYLLGALIQKLMRDNDGRVQKTCLIGTFFLLFIWSVMVNTLELLDLGFSVVSKTFSVLLLFIFIAAMLLCRQEIKRQLQISRAINVMAVIIIAVVCIIQIICFFVISPDTKGDSTIEMVNTVLATDSTFGYDALTGSPVKSVGIGDRLHTLPLLYAYIATVFGDRVSSVCYRAMPVWVYLLCLMVYSLYADSLFENSERKPLSVAYFVGGVGLISICGAFSEGSLFYYQSLRGFSGEAFCYSVVLPMCIYECYYGFRNKRSSSIIYVIVMMLGSLCALSIDKGLIPIAMEVIICMLVAAGYRVRRYLKCKR